MTDRQVVHPASSDADLAPDKTERQSTSTAITPGAVASSTATRGFGGFPNTGGGFIGGNGGYPYGTLYVPKVKGEEHSEVKGKDEGGGGDGSGEKVRSHAYAASDGKAGVDEKDDVAVPGGTSNEREAGTSENMAGGMGRMAGMGGRSRDRGGPQ